MDSATKSSSVVQGEDDNALDWLSQAVAAGYSKPDHMQRDGDLASLREYDTFPKLVETARRNAAALRGE